MEGRKQNTACDACRARKVKCNRVPGSDRCVHCATKNLECTHFQQQATQHKKRAPRSGDAPSSATPSYSGPPRPRAADGDDRTDTHLGHAFDQCQTKAGQKERVEQQVQEVAQAV